MTSCNLGKETDVRNGMKATHLDGLGGVLREAATSFLVSLVASVAIACAATEAMAGETITNSPLEAYLARNPPKDVLARADGTRIKTAEEWTAKVRPAVLKFFDEGVYGVMPPKPAKGSKTVTLCSGSSS